jgi:hypothetical protein
MLMAGALLYFYLLVFESSTPTQSQPFRQGEAVLDAGRE